MIVSKHFTVPSLKVSITWPKMARIMNHQSLMRKLYIWNWSYICYILEYMQVVHSYGFLKSWFFEPILHPPSHQEEFNRAGQCHSLLITLYIPIVTLLYMAIQLDSVCPMVSNWLSLTCLIFSTVPIPLGSWRQPYSMEAKNRIGTTTSHASLINYTRKWLCKAGCL